MVFSQLPHGNGFSPSKWFELDGKIKVDEDLVYKMREFLDALDQADGSFIRISDNQYLSLTKQFRRDLNLLKAMGKFKGKIHSGHISEIIDPFRGQMRGHGRELI